jgi:hypothetical protein
MTLRGRCRCGKLLEFHPGPDGFKKRCNRCGSVVRLRFGGAGASAAGDSGKQVPSWTYAPTEELAPVAGDVEEPWSSGDLPPLPPPVPQPRSPVAVSSAEDEWSLMEKAPDPSPPPPASLLSMPMMIVGAVALVALGVLVVYMIAGH